MANFVDMKKVVSLLIILAMMSLLAADLDAQCAMCKQVAEDASNQSGQAVGLGLNNGIKWLLAIPYLLFGIFLLVFFKKKNKLQAQ